MEQLDLFLLFTRQLDQHHFDYMTTGSVASMLYGIPRLTHDLDLVLILPPNRIAELSSCFSLESFYCPPVEVLKVEGHREQRGHFNIIHHDSGYKADIYIHGKDPLERWGLEGRRRIDLTPGDSIWVAPPEYVIARKMEFFREGGSDKHLADIAGIFSVSRELIHMEELKGWLEQRGTLLLWQEKLPNLPLD
jgi:hypothetical protein